MHESWHERSIEKEAQSQISGTRKLHAQASKHADFAEITVPLVEICISINQENNLLSFKSWSGSILAEAWILH